MKVKSLALLLPLFASSAFAAPLHLDVYNPQEKGIFPVSSTLVSGPKEAILFDAQFSTKDGEQLVQMIRASGKTLKAIVITSGDPDFYFGLQPIVNAFPQVKVLATPQVVDHIRATKEAKLQFWGPQMKDARQHRSPFRRRRRKRSSRLMVNRWNCVTPTIMQRISGSRRIGPLLAAQAWLQVFTSGRRIHNLKNSVVHGVTY